MYIRNDNIIDTHLPKAINIPSIYVYRRVKACEKMIGKYVGLAMFGGGILLLVGYGIYNLIKEISNINAIVLTAILAIIGGIVILLISTAMDRKSKELKYMELF